MSRKTASARPGPDRASLYDEITGQIIAELEAGRVPWVQPWGTAAAKAPLAMPKNAATGRQYSGINVLILWGAVIEHGFPAQSWLTFRQALSLGGNVRKGEHGTTVVYADRFVPDDEKRRARETGEEAAAIPFLKRFTVFNAAQCENLQADIAAVAPLPRPGLIEPRVEALIRATGVDFRIGGNRAFYAPGPDFVVLSACRPDQCAWEVDETVLAADGTRTRRPHGALTLSLLDALHAIPAEQVQTLRWMDFYDSLSRAVTGRVRDATFNEQHPSTEGAESELPRVSAGGRYAPVGGGTEWLDRLGPTKGSGDPRRPAGHR